MQDKFEEYLEDCTEVREKIKSIREDERKRFLNKACEWLWNEIYERINDSEIRESLYDDNYRANLVAAFREAMEE